MKCGYLCERRGAKGVTFFRVFKFLVSGWELYEES
jgi:hypothetical protein